MGDEVDLLEHLERKKKEMAAMQEAANMAKEQALALLQLQRRVAEIDALANGGPVLESSPAETSIGAPEASLVRVAGASLAYPSAASAESRRQSTPPRAANALPPRSSNTPPPRTSLSIEDRRRFGLDDNPPATVHNSVEPDASYPSMTGHPSATKMASAAADGSVSSNFDIQSPMAAANQRLGRNRGGSRTGAAVSAVLNAPSEAAQLPTPLRSPGSHPDISQQLGSSRAAVPRPPRWSSLSAEDRRRFGLDFDGDDASPSQHAAVSQPVEPKSRARYSAQGAIHHPDVLWGADGGSADSGMTPSMTRTLAQLEAVGATKLVADLRESERRLQSLKMSG